MIPVSQLHGLVHGDWENRVAERDRWDRAPFNAWPFEQPMVPHASLQLYESGFRPSYPNGAGFAVCLSHDVDRLMTSRRELLGTMRRRQRAMDRANLRALLCGTPDPEFTLNRLLEVEARHGVRSSFYFLALRPGEEDFNFDLRRVGEQLRLVGAAGCEIGLHGGHRAYADASVLATEAERLREALGGAKAIGYRNHYLRFRLPSTWRLLQDAGFTYDTTLGWSETIGFRNGLCYPYHPVDSSTGERFRITEIPLAVMDQTLFGHMRLAPREGLALFWRLVDQVMACQGVLTLLWHNGFPLAPLSVYEEMLAGLQARGAWFATGTEVVRHWHEAGLSDRMEATLIDLCNTSG